MKEWNQHYTREKAALSYPDENLVRLLNRWLREEDRREEPLVLDLGCGSGRHLKLLEEAGIESRFGSDGSYEGLVMAKRFSTALVQCDNRRLPFAGRSLDAVIAWGSLHYCRKADTKAMIDELSRVLRPGGLILGTMRSGNDTMLRRGEELGNNEWVTDLADLSGSVVSFFSEDEVRENFKNNFLLELGLMERSAPGNLAQKVSHWIFRATKN